jgi:hypothetical protein
VFVFLLVSTFLRYSRIHTVHTLHFAKVFCSFLLDVSIEIAQEGKGDVERASELIMEIFAFLQLCGLYSLCKVGYYLSLLPEGLNAKLIGMLKRSFLKI